LLFVHKYFALMNNAYLSIEVHGAANCFDIGACEGTPEELTASSGTIQSPGYATNEYPDNANCQWRIIAPSGTVSTSG